MEEFIFDAEHYFEQDRNLYIESFKASYNDRPSEYFMPLVNTLEALRLFVGKNELMTITKNVIWLNILKKLR